MSPSSPPPVPPRRDRTGRVARLGLGVATVVVAVAAIRDYRYHQRHGGPGRIQADVRECAFRGEHYSMLLLRDADSDLALGVNQGDFKDSNFGTRIHDAAGGPKEYSCYPDDVVFVERGGRIERAYAGYLAWQHATLFAEDASVARSTYSHAPGDGLLQRYVEPGFLQAMSDMQADIEVQHELCTGRPWITTTVRFTSAYDEAVHVWWLYQDGVFVHLPNQDQRAVTAVSSAGGGRMQVFPGAPDAWVGLADFTAGVASIVHAPAARWCFVLPNYFGVRGDEVAVPGQLLHGIVCEYGGNDRFWVEHAEVPARLARLPGLPRAVSADDLKIQGVLFDLGELQPGAARELQLHRFGVQGRGHGEVAAQVGPILAAIAGAEGGR